jgi:hypothetical protein
MAISTNESDIERKIREDSERRQRSRTEQQQRAAFYESAIDYAVADVAMPLIEGLKKSVGDVGPVEPDGKGPGWRKFRTAAEMRNGRIRVVVFGLIKGAGPIVENPREVNFRFGLEGWAYVHGRRAHQFTIIRDDATSVPRPVPTAESIANTVTRAVTDVLGIP